MNDLTDDLTSQTIYDTDYGTPLELCPSWSLDYAGHSIEATLMFEGMNYEFNYQCSYEGGNELTQSTISFAIGGGLQYYSFEGFLPACANQVPESVTYETFIVSNGLDFVDLSGLEDRFMSEAAIRLTHTGIELNTTETRLIDSQLEIVASYAFSSDYSECNG